MSDHTIQIPGQLDLLGPSYPSPPHNGTETSIAAAESVRGSATSQQERIYAWLAANGPASDEAIGLALGLSGDTVRPRRGALRDAGRIVQDGECVTVKGRRAVTWRVA